MYLTNNDKTIYNLTLYSDGVYAGRNSQFKGQDYTSYYRFYLNLKPFGNMGFWGGHLSSILEKRRETYVFY